MEEKYPIQPHHLDSSKEPKGFDNFLDYGQRVVLWAFIQFAQARGSWEPFTHEAFLSFMDNKDSKVNKAIKSGVIWFVEPRLRAIFNCVSEMDDDKKVTTYTPTHFVISTYFLWNPAR
jgi:hypothetical protein